MATRRSTGFEFDHGAQYFTVRDEAFARVVATWIDEEVAAPWLGRVVEITNGSISLKEEQPRRYVGIPRMNSVCGHLARDFDISLRSGDAGDPLCEIDLISDTIYVNWLHPTREKMGDSMFLKSALFWRIAYLAANGDGDLMMNVAHHLLSATTD